MDCIVMDWILNTFETLPVQKEMGYQGTHSSQHPMFYWTGRQGVMK